MAASKRRIATALVALTSAMALTVAGCGNDSSGKGAQTEGGVTTLTWQMWSGSEIETEALNHLSEMVTAKHPDIKIQLQTSTFPDYWTKIPAQASSGDVGCLLGVQGPRVPLISQLLLPLEDAKLKEAGIEMGEFNGEMSKALQADGKQVAVPYDLGPLVVFYNADAFKKAGADLPKPGWSLADFEAASKKLKDSGTTPYGFFPTTDQFTAWAMTLKGKQPIDEGGTLSVDNPEMVEVFQYLASMRADGMSPELPATTDTSTALNAYMAGNVAMVVDGPWQYGNIVKNAHFKPGLAPMPAGPAGSSSQIAGSGYGISRTCAAPDKALQALAVMTGPEALQYLGEIGRAYPARTAQSSAWYQGDLADAKPSLEYAIEHGKFLQTNAKMNQFNQLFVQYGIPAFNGQQDASAFLKQVQQQVGS